MKVPQSLRDLIEGAEALVELEDLSAKRGLMQAINPLAKLFAVATMIVISLFIYSPTYLVAICAVPLFLALLSKIPLKQFLSRSAIIPMFTAVIALPVLFLTSGQPIIATNVGGLSLVMTMEGVSRFLVFTLRVWFCVSSLSLLVLSTGFDRMLKVLSSLRVPSIIVQLFALTYRYFFVSVHEAQSVLIAKEARTYVNKKTINLQALRDFGGILASLFIRTYERSERVYWAMKARGFEVESQSSRFEMPSFRVLDFLFASTLIMAFALLTLL